MHDPRTPEILAWVEAMPLVERLTVMHAMTFVFPLLKSDRTWKARMAAVRTELKPTADELGDILIEASRISARLKLELAA
jgi:hypothetical protein